MRVVQLRQIQNSRTTTAFANPSDAIVDATFHLLGINKSLLSVSIFGNMQISGDKSLSQKLGLLSEIFVSDVFCSSRSKIVQS